MVYKRLLSLWIALFLAALQSDPAARPPARTLLPLASEYVPDPQFPAHLPNVKDGRDLKQALLPAPAGPRFTVGATSHLFVQNRSEHSIRVESLALNDIDLVRHLPPIHRENQGIRAASFWLNDATTTPPPIQRQLEALGAPVWYRIEPNPVPANGYAEILLRLRVLPQERNLKIALGNQDSTDCRFRSDPSTESSVQIARVAFSEEMDRVYLYLRSLDTTDFALQSLQFDDRILTYPRNSAPMSAKGFLAVEIPLDRSIEPASYHWIAAKTRTGAQASTLARAWKPYFALGMWGYRRNGATEAEQNRDTCTAFARHLFNTHMGMGGGYVRTPEGLEMLKELGLKVMISDPMSRDAGHPQLYARFLMDEPDAHEASIEALPGPRRVGSFAQGLVQKREKWMQEDPLTPILLNVDLTYKPENWLTYGQLPDIFALDPYFIGQLCSAYWKHPGWLGQYSHPYYVFALSEIARFASQPKPLHVILNAVSAQDPGNNRAFRYSTPDEKRIEFYYALAAGAQGISYWWFTPYGECKGCGSDQPEAIALMKAMARLNAEAETLAPLLTASCPGAFPGERDPFVSTQPPWLIPRTLFAGEQTALILLVNRDHLSDRMGSLYQPIEKARVSFECPPWLEAKHIFRFRNGRMDPIEVQLTGTRLEWEMREIELTEAVLVTDRPGTIVSTQKRWKEIEKRLDFLNIAP